MMFLSIIGVGLCFVNVVSLIVMTSTDSHVTASGANRVCAVSVDVLWIIILVLWAGWIMP